MFLSRYTFVPVFLSIAQYMYIIWLFEFTIVWANMDANEGMLARLSVSWVAIEYSYTNIKQSLVLIGKIYQFLCDCIHITLYSIAIINLKSYLVFWCQLSREIQPVETSVTGIPWYSVYNTKGL